jgi:hypothetical protein
MKDLIFESALFPILEAALRSGSLLEMAKEINLFNSYMDLIAELANNRVLSHGLMDIGDDYIPKQRESI